MSALLELRGLRLALGEFRLGPLSLELAAGDYLVLLGPSGCGKTSLLRAVAGIYPNQPGQLFLEGQDVGRLAPHMRRVGYVSQTADLFPHRSVAANIAFGLSYLPLSRPERRERARDMAAVLGVEGLLGRNPATLSGGEAKRVALARSLVVDPRVLLLDEPLSMLDHNARRRMLDLLRIVHDRLGTATIHVTHDREEAWAMGGGCAVMDAGRIEGSGGVEELFRRPARRFVAEFLGGENLFSARFERRGEKCFAVLDWAELPLAGTVDFADGWVQIRPESLLVAGPECPEAFGVTVLSVTDRGIYREIRASTRSGKVLVCHAVMTGERVPAPGEMLMMRLADPPHAIEGEGHA